MKLDFLFVAKSVRREPSGMLHALSIFDIVRVASFPHQHPSPLNVAGRFSISVRDLGIHRLRVVVVDPDGQMLTDSSFEMNVALSANGVLDYGSVPFSLAVGGLVIAEPGEHAVEIFIDNIQAGSTPIMFVLDS